MSSYKFGKSKQIIDDEKKLKIAVDFNNKDTVKNLNGKWDPEKKEWYILYDDLTPELLNKLYQLQVLKTIGIIKKVHHKGDDAYQYFQENNIFYFDIGRKYTSLIETYTIQELENIYKNHKVTQVN